MDRHNWFPYKYFVTAIPILDINMIFRGMESIRRVFGVGISDSRYSSGLDLPPINS